MFKKKYALLLLVSLIVTCSKVYHREYYILDYVPHLVHTAQKGEILPYRTEVADISIVSSYDRPQIVIRKSFHKLRYDTYSLWAIRPQIAIADLLERHLKEAKIFLDVKREFLNVRADFKIYGHIYNLEFYQSQNVQRADIEMKLLLQDAKSESVLVTHSFRRFDPIDQADMSFFAKKISDILQEEHNVFIRKIRNFFQTEKGEKRN